MNASAFDSAVHACALVGLDSCANQVSASVPSLDLKNMVLIFVVAFSRGIAAYLRKNDITNVLAPALPTILKVQEDVQKAGAAIDAAAVATQKN